MLKTRLAAVLVAAAVGAIGLAGVSGTAAAVPLSGSIPVLAKEDANLVLVASGKKDKKKTHNKKVVKKKNVWVYNGKKHGKRYKVKVAGYPYYYGGWYYRKPWWGYEPGIFLCLGC